MGNIRIPFPCATKCGTFNICATSATNVAKNVAQFNYSWIFFIIMFNKHCMWNKLFVIYSVLLNIIPYKICPSNWGAFYVCPSFEGQVRGKKYSPFSIQYFNLTQAIVIGFGLNLKIFIFLLGLSGGAGVFFNTILSKYSSNLNSTTHELSKNI